MRALWLLLGGVSFALGAVGIFLPLLPTVPFLLLSAFAFAQSSERLHGWLLSHRVFGPPIEDWRHRGAIRRKAKWMATASILAAFLVSIALGLRPAILAVQAATLLSVAVFIWTRPES
ncbi:MAG: YbaN family protein [Paracoccaceae bacterium]